MSKDNQNFDSHVHGEHCNHEHDHDTVTLTLDDGEELECPIIDIFVVNEQEYIALLHPEDETALLYRFHENDDETIDLEPLEDDEEFEKVSKIFLDRGDEFDEDEDND